MKKSNKVSIFYVLTSIALLLVLMFGGIYGIYISVGLNFVKSSVTSAPGAPVPGASNVAIGGTVNFEYSMVGVILLSIALVILSIFDIVSLIRQIVFFKQFKAVKNSSLEKKVEKKIKSKGAVVFFTILIDIISIALGIVGIFINARTFVGNNFAWILYVVDGLIVLFALWSMILLIMKLRALKRPANEDNSKRYLNADRQNDGEVIKSKSYKVTNYDIDEFEYKLLKLKHMKNTKVISQDEYKALRDKLLRANNSIVEAKKDDK